MMYFWITSIHSNVAGGEESTLRYTFIKVKFWGLLYKPVCVGGIYVAENSKQITNRIKELGPFIKTVILYSWVLHFPLA